MRLHDPIPILVLSGGVLTPRSIATDASVDLLRPRVDAAVEIEYLLEAVRREKLRDSPAAPAEVTEHDDRLVLRELVETCRHLHHRDVQSVRDRGLLELL